jgi:tetratricopeptide (TPR) repeat protein
MELMAARSSGKGKKSQVASLNQPSKIYLSALLAFWQGRLETAIETLTEELKREINRSSVKYYRLWLEILVEKGETASIRMLADHFGELIHTDFGDDYAALKGLVHLELGERDAAQLYCNAVKNLKKNPYAAELSTRVAMRKGAEDASAPLYAVRANLGDYFHFQTLIAARKMEGLPNSDIVRSFNQFFEEFPLSQLFELDELVANQKFDKALKTCQKLADQFPTNRNLRLKLAYLKLEQGLADEALAEFTKARHSERDQEYLLGRSLVFAKKSLSDRSPDLWDKAQAYFVEAERALTESGHHGDLHKALKTQIANRTVAERKPSNDGKMWLLKVSARLFNNLKDLPLTQVRSLALALGEGPKEGDWCVIASSDYTAGYYQTNDFTWRFGAVYEIGYRFGGILSPNQCHMSLVNRPEISVPVNCGPLDEIEQFGDSTLYELSEDAQKRIVEMLDRFTADRRVSGDLLSDFRKFVS